MPKAGVEPKHRETVRTHRNFFLFLYNVFFLFIQLLEKAGFVDVKAIDNTKRFIEVLTSERARFETEKNTFLKV